MPRIVIMGVSGCGKTTVGTTLADKIGGQFQDGDWFHSQENRAKMGAGTPLTDADREPWLQSLKRILEEKENVVLACSALKYSYRQKLRESEQTTRDKVVFVHLEVPESILLERLTARQAHYFPQHLLTSQLQCLEPANEGEVILKVDNTQPVETVIQLITSLMS
eukprot:TRINITY_DN19659_c0_g1_i1.p1 TRINITY_DN19659_c0_g1~~TRINITY_DN19659_c0_g1_i1.p1  ORF type:complete len:165 (+),score=21.29 TRINITY_DN19659_c0_g1_i1:1-495(+)